MAEKYSIFSRSKFYAFAVAAALSLAACQGHKEITHPPTDSGNTNEKALSPTPYLTAQQQVQLTIEELMRVHRMTSLAINRPSISSADGCVSLDVANDTRFLVRTYSCDREFQPGWNEHRDGREVFSLRQGQVAVQSGLKVDLSPIGQKTKIAQTSAENRSLTILLPDIGDNIKTASYPTEFETTRGDPSNGTSQNKFWKLSGTLNWRMLVDQTLLLRDKVALKFAYIPGPGSPVSIPTANLSFITNGELQFPASASTKCEWPLGMLDYVDSETSTDGDGPHVSLQAGTIKMTNTGWEDEKRDLKMDWPSTCPDGT